MEGARFLRRMPPRSRAFQELSTFRGAIGRGAGGDPTGATVDEGWF